MSEVLYEPFREECIDGEIYMLSTSANPKHGRVISNIVYIFNSFLRGSDCDVFSDSIDVYLDRDRNDLYVIPDVSIICEPEKVTRKGYEGVPTLIVEVISPSTKNRDEMVKYKLYEKYGVKEYWQVNYLDKSIKQSVLDDSGKYQDRIYSLLDEVEYSKLSDSNKEAYSDKFNCFMFNMEIGLDEVFYHVDKFNIL